MTHKSHPNEVKISQDKDRDLNKADNNESTESAVEIGGRNGPDPTRYGDWEKKGRCIDF